MRIVRPPNSATLAAAQVSRSGEPGQLVVSNPHAYIPIRSRTSAGGRGTSAGTGERGALLFGPCPPHVAVTAAEQTRTAIVATRRRSCLSIESTRIAVSSDSTPCSRASGIFEECYESSQGALCANALKVLVRKTKANRIHTRESASR